MFEVIAGEASGETYESGLWSEVFDEGEAPGHVSVCEAVEVATARYAEDSLTDTELLGLAAEDALDAVAAAELGGPGLDEVALQRAQRRARRAGVGRVLRTSEGAIA